MIGKSLVCSVAFAATASASAYAEHHQGDHAALLALADKAFAAVTSQNPDDWRAIQLANGVTLSMRPAPDGPDGAHELRLKANEEFLASLHPADNHFVERWTAEPVVLVRGPIAVIWGEYEFLIDGKRNHCGVDSIDAVKVNGEWKIANFMWTVEKEGC